MSNTENTLFYGSNPCRTASFPQENAQSGLADTILTQETPDSEAESEKDVKYPYHLKHRGKVLATIYKPGKAYPLYRVAWRAAGKRQMKSFPSYSAAKAHADGIKKELAKGSQVPLLTAGQANDALTALERLARFFRDTGKQISLAEAVDKYCELAGRLNGYNLSDVADKFLNTVATVKRVDILKAVEDFIESRRAKTVAKEGKRPQLSPEHHYLTSIWLKEFAKSFPGSAVCDLTKAHMGIYMAKHVAAAPKTRNERRGVVKMFLAWAVEKDYLPATHRLLEASELKHENSDPESIELYTADELRAMLERASVQPGTPKKGEEAKPDFRELFPVLALAGLAGIRLKEIMRMTFADVFRVAGHIEVKAQKSKTRSRRLIPMCSALAQWLESYRTRTGPIWAKSYDMFHLDFAALREELKIANRRNGLRHSFISAHFAAYSDEGLTAAQAGNSPDMIHKHYKGLLTKTEGEAWFAVAPKQPANVIPFTAAAVATK